MEGIGDEVSFGDGTGGPEEVRLVDGGGNSWQANREGMNAAAILAFMAAVAILKKDKMLAIVASKRKTDS